MLVITMVPFITLMVMPGMMPIIISSNAAIIVIMMIMSGWLW